MKRRTPPSVRFAGSVSYTHLGLTLEGKLTRIAYRIDGKKSALEVYRNYQGALQAGGFKTLFECKGDEQCGGDFQSFVLNSGKVSPVSYTHLDVYKRQALDRSSWISTMSSAAVAVAVCGASGTLSSTAGGACSGQPLSADQIEVTVSYPYGCLLYTSRCV